MSSTHQRHNCRNISWRRRRTVGRKRLLPSDHHHRLWVLDRIRTFPLFHYTPRDCTIPKNLLSPTTYHCSGHALLTVESLTSGCQRTTMVWCSPQWYSQGSENRRLIHCSTSHLRNDTPSAFSTILGLNYYMTRLQNTMRSFKPVSTRLRSTDVFTNLTR